MTASQPGPTDLSAMLDLHVRMQRGCYVSGVDAAPDGGRLIWSERIAEHGLNLAVSTRDGAWIRQAAARRGRPPVVLAEDMAAARAICLALQGAPVAALAWMTRPVTPEDGAGETESVELSDRPAPDEAFLSVLARLSPSAAANAATMDAYGPTLREARVDAGVAVRHLTWRQDGEPVACASIHAVDGVAGLYNVGVVAERQRAGLGRRITAQAIGAAAALGCSSLLLQCLPGGHVERLYAGLGFRRAARPLLIGLH